MAKASQRSSKLARRYAVALMDLAEAERSVDRAVSGLQTLSHIIEESEEFRRFIKSPLLSKKQQDQIIADIAQKTGLEGLVRKFLGVLIENRRLAALPEIITAFQEEAARRKGEVGVEVKIAQDMSAKEKEALAGSIGEALNTKVNITTEVAPEILGGMIVTVGSKMVDDSVARKLELLKTAMKSQVGGSEKAA